MRYEDLWSESRQLDDILMMVAFRDGAWEAEDSCRTKAEHGAIHKYV